MSHDSVMSSVCVSVCVCHIWWLRLVGSLKSLVSFAKETHKRDYILQKRPIILKILLIVAPHMRT